MKTHYTEADLLETWYMQPGASMPVMMHLADCKDCASRYQSLERKLRTMHACEIEKPETFWARQRMSIQRRVAAGRNARPRFARFAAAAALTLTVGGLVTWKVSEQKPLPAATPAAVATVATVNPVTEPSPAAVPNDPWQSDQLKDFQSIVAWESWGEPGTGGDQSL